jgi:hypothetical protein
MARSGCLCLVDEALSVGAQLQMNNRLQSMLRDHRSLCAMIAQTSIVGDAP